MGNAIIPALVWGKLLMELRAAGFNEATLFPDLDHLASEIEREELEGG